MGYIEATQIRYERAAIGEIRDASKRDTQLDLFMENTINEKLS